MISENETLTNTINPEDQPYTATGDELHAS